MRPSVAKMAILGISLSLWGCFSARPCARSFDLSTTDLARNVENALESSFFFRGEYPRKDWWQLFEDDQLSYFIEKALCDNPDIHLAQERIHLAYYKACEVRSKLLPHFDLFGSYIRQRESLYDIGIPDFLPLIEGDNLLFNMATMLFRGVYEVDVWAKNRNSYYAECGKLAAEKAEKQEVMLLISSMVAKSYFALQTHLLQKEILNKQLAAKKEAYLLLRERYFRGMADEFFVYIFSREVADIQNDVAAIEGTIAVDIHTLAALLGGGIEEELKEPLLARVETKMALPENLPLNLLAHRPDIQAALWRIQAGGYGVKVAKARFFPNLNLNAFIGSSSYFVSQFFTNPSLKIWGEAISILPVYTAGELRAKLGEAQTRLDIAVEEYNQLLLRATKEVCDAISLKMSSEEQRQKIHEAVEDSRELYDLTLLKFSHGIDTQIRVQNALSNLYLQQLLEAEIGLKQKVAATDLFYALGGGYGS